jgi:hypothetical protein
MDAFHQHICGHHGMVFKHHSSIIAYGFDRARVHNLKRFCNVVNQAEFPIVQSVCVVVLSSIIDKITIMICDALTI